MVKFEFNDIGNIIIFLKNDSNLKWAISLYHLIYFMILRV